MLLMLWLMFPNVLTQIYGVTEGQFGTSTAQQNNSKPEKTIDHEAYQIVSQHLEKIETT